MYGFTASDLDDPNTIFLVYVSKQCSTITSHAFYRGYVDNIVKLQEEESVIDLPQGLLNTNCIVRFQYDDDLEWLDNMDSFTPYMVEGCKYIIVGAATDVINAAEEIYKSRRGIVVNGVRK
ncbi:hypothetical protein GGI08_004172 [Coemansia sp. S2]|nr:hypothetical protein GGI08_004172 [Coemansia sp. S2]